MEKVVIYTDGACSGNPGPGGWGAVLMYQENKKEIAGGQKNTTNNVMELTAVIEGLKLLKYPCEVELYSDSAYVVNAFEKGWLDKWVKNNWKTLCDLTQIHKVKFHKVKGHSDNQYNNRCDELARNAIPKG